MKNGVEIIDSPKEKTKSKIIGSLCGAKPNSKKRDFDDFFNEDQHKQTHFSNDVLQKIEFYLQKSPIPLPTEANEKYSLIEDLLIILMKAKGISNEKILPYRSEASIKSRYFKRLKILTNKNMGEIFQYIEKKGIENIGLSFTKNGQFQGINDKNGVILLDNEIEEENKESLIKESSKSNEEESDEEMVNEENYNSSENNQIEIENNNNAEEYYSNNEQENILDEKTIKKQNISPNQCCKMFDLLTNIDKNKRLPCLISKDSNSSINNSTIQKENLSILKNYKTEMREIMNVPSEALKILMKLEEKFDKSIKVLVQDLYKVSGNIKDLVEYYEDTEKMEYITWSSEEDSILEKITSSNEMSFKLLIRYKGIDRVRSRIKFKHLKKDFHL